MGQYRHPFKHKKVPLRAVKDESGAMLLSTCLFLVLILIFVGLAADFARFVVAQEELQGAVDSASLAATLEAKRKVALEWKTGHCECCGIDKCGCCCESDGCYVQTGYEKDLLTESGYPKRYPRCWTYYGIRRRWMEWNVGSARDLSAQMVQANWPGLLDGGQIDEITVYDKPGSKYYPSVVVKASGWVDTVFARILGIDSLHTQRRSQSTVRYYPIENGYGPGVSPVPKNAID